MKSINTCYTWEHSATRGNGVDMQESKKEMTYLNIMYTRLYPCQMFNFVKISLEVSQSTPAVKDASPKSWRSLNNMMMTASYFLGFEEQENHPTVTSPELNVGPSHFCKPVFSQLCGIKGGFWTWDPETFQLCSWQRSRILGPIYWESFQPFFELQNQAFLRHNMIFSSPLYRAFWHKPNLVLSTTLPQHIIENWKVRECKVLT